MQDVISFAQDDKDGYPDIVGFGNNGTFVSLNKAGTGFNPATGWISDFGLTAGGWQVGMHPRLIG